MDEKRVRVLLIGENETGFASLREWLEKRGCYCEFAYPHANRVELLAKGLFDLIFCSDRVAGMSGLLSSVANTPATSYCCHTVEDGYWWLPVTRDGKKCLGEPGLQPNEFAKQLEQTVEKIKSTKSAKAIGAPG
jgi:hypothetical protein